MAAWQWLIDSAGVLVLIVALYGIALVLRRRWLARGGGTFELSVHAPRRTPGQGWTLGLGRYDDSALEWFRVFTPWPRPKRTWRREELRFLSQREPSGRESFLLYPGHVIVVCSTATGSVELAMSPAALTGLQAWLEGAPPSDPAIRRKRR